ncbi:MAG: hypothetical protein PHV97_00625 [Candidatus Omnitrophica bacterium]|nr:hypothetical protein [Candidatus Omnitrophota bacterium]
MSIFSSRIDTDLALLKAEIEFLKADNIALREELRLLVGTSQFPWTAIGQIERNLNLLLEHLNLKVVHRPEKTILEKKKTK